MSYECISSLLKPIITYSGMEFHQLPIRIVKRHTGLELTMRQEKMNQDWTLQRAPVTVALEVEPELEDAVGKLAAEAMPVRVFPLSVDNLESDVFVGRSSMEAQGGEVLVVGQASRKYSGVRVEDIKLVTLHNLGRRVVEIVVGLVVLVPLKPGVHSVEETRLAGTVFVSPQVGLASQGHFHTELGLVSPHSFFGPAEKNILGTLAGITWELVGGEQPGAVFASIVIIQALLN
ncbi:hypothetical protein E2320_022001 [Naja naja]|nr:hypothetical protein E2320_022001 [Naja naja]